MMLSLQQQIHNQHTPPNQPQNPNTRPRRQRKYYWTYGNCNHNSLDCKNKAQGHIDSATFKNKQGGSERGCNPQQGWRCGTEIGSRNNKINNISKSLNSVVPPKPLSSTTNTKTAKADSGATQRYFTAQDATFFKKTSKLHLAPPSIYPTEKSYSQ